MALLQRRKKHHRKRKTRISRKNVLERFVTSYLFKISGIVVVMIGVFYALNSSEILYWLKEMILKLFQPSDEIQVLPEDATGSVATLIRFFSPGLIILVLSGLFAKRLGFTAYLFSLLAVIYFAFLQANIIYNFGYIVYNTFIIADIFLVLSMIGPLMNAILFKRPGILILSAVYLYFSMLVLTTKFGLQVNYLLPLSIVFTLCFTWLAGVIRNPMIILVNLVLAIGFFGLFWLRKLVVNSHEDNLPAFFIYGALFYILFYGIGFYTSSAKGKMLPKWLLLTLVFVNLLFYFGTTSYVIIKYFSYGWLSVFVIALLLFNLAGLYLFQKEIPVWKVPHHIITFVFASLILPLLLNQSNILLFSAMFSVLLLLYLRHSKNRNFILVSMVAIGIMTLDFYFQWVFKYFPAITISKDLLSLSLFVNGIMNGVVVMVALTFNYWFLKNIRVSLPKNLFSKTRYVHLIKGLMLVAIFLTTGWIVANFICSISKSSHLAAPGWFISGSIFFVLFFLIRSKTFGFFLRPILLIATLFTVVFSLLVQISMSASLNDLMFHGILSVETVLVHYLAVGLGTCLAAIIIVRLFQLFPANIFIRRALQLFGLVLLTFTLLSEYDNLSILFSAGQFIANPTTHLGNQIFEINHRLPYSFILLSLSMIMLVWALLKHLHFLRNLSILLFSLSIVKIFLYDFTLIGNTTRTVLFFVVGFLLIGVSFLYPRLKKAASGTRSQHRHHHIKQRNTEKAGTVVENNQEG